jgi:hypothetical protein
LFSDIPIASSTTPSLEPVERRKERPRPDLERPARQLLDAARHAEAVQLAERK